MDAAGRAWHRARRRGRSRRLCCQSSSLPSKSLAKSTSKGTHPKSPLTGRFAIPGSGGMDRVWVLVFDPSLKFLAVAIYDFALRL